MKGNLKNLNELIAGSVVLFSTGDIGVVRFLMGDIVTKGVTGDISQAGVCITQAGSESYSTYRSDGISHYGHSYDICEVISVGDGVEIKSSSEARDRLRAFDASTKRMVARQAKE